MCGIAINLCCQYEGCEAVLRNKELLYSLVSLPERCTDTSVLLQAFELLYRLVTHCKNKTKNTPLNSTSSTNDGNTSTDKIFDQLSHDLYKSSTADVFESSTADLNISNASDHNKSLSLDQNNPSSSKISSSPDHNISVTSTLRFVEILRTCSLEQFFSFILSNSLNESFIELSLKLLQSLLFLKDPTNEDKLLAEHYAHEELVIALVSVARKWHEEALAKKKVKADKFDSDEDDEEKIRGKFTTVNGSKLESGQQNENITKSQLT